MIIKNLSRIAVLCAFLACGGTPLHSQSFTCSAYTTTDSIGRPVINEACFASALGTTPQTFSYDSGPMAIPGSFATTGFIASENKNGQSYTNEITGRVCNSDCSILTIFTMNDAGSVNEIFEENIGYPAATVRC